MTSPAVEDYLKTIYKLQSDGRVAMTHIARALNVSSASVTNMVKRLAQMKLVLHEAYKGVRLTEAGEKVALEMIRHHRLLETYLKEVMGYSWAEMHEEAERLEHHISEEFENKIDAMLGYPTHDPHGHPIPTADLQITERETIFLSEVEVGESVRVHHVSDTDTNLLQYLEEINLLPGKEVKILARAPFDGPVTIRVADREHVVGYQVAKSVHVVSTSDNSFSQE